MVRIDSIKDIKDFGFGQYFSPWCVQAKFSEGKWGNVALGPLENISLDPAAKVFHYGQEIFEGLKVYRQSQGGLALFRPEANIERMKRSAEILAMPPFPANAFMEALLSLSRKCADFVPAEPGTLYLRPTMIGTSPTLGVAPSADYLFYILASPVGGYFKTAGSDVPPAVSVWVSDKHVRAVHGGLGAAKTGANYAASLRAVSESKRHGFSNVLFLDAVQRKYFEELSGMNIFVVEDGVLKTPPVSDTILEGVTRDSLLKIAAQNKIPTLEEAPQIDQVIQGLQKGRITEIFACGTGAVITAISEIGYKNERYKIADGQAGPLSTRLYRKLLGIQFGREKSFASDWIVAL